MVYSLFCLVLITIYLALTIIIGALLSVIFVIPFVLLYIFVMIRKSFVWSNQRMAKSEPPVHQPTVTINENIQILANETKEVD